MLRSSVKPGEEKTITIEWPAHDGWRNKMRTHFIERVYDPSIKEDCEIWLVFNQDFDNEHEVYNWRFICRRKGKKEWFQVADHQATAMQHLVKADWMKVYR